MYEIAELRDMLTRYKLELSVIVGRYDALCDKCLADDLNDVEEDEVDYLDEQMEKLDDALDVINELLDKYGFR